MKNNPKAGARRLRRVLTAGIVTAGLAAAGLPAIITGPAMAAPLPYQDQALPFSVRAADLVSRMTPEEKAQQFNSTLPNFQFMGPPAPAIPRLGVRQYTYWNEALHGVAREGQATEFPTGQGIAASWNRELVQQMTAAVSDEGRGKYNEVCLSDAAKTDLNLICRGMTYWSPTINLARDPRWGRADENYGEDPYLAGEIAGQFVLGLQGGHTSNPDSVGGTAQSYLKAVSTPKHYLANNSEINRHTGTSNLTDRSLHEYYTAAFGKAAGKEYGAKSIMPSYNSVNVDSDYTKLHGAPTVVIPTSEDQYRGVEVEPTIGTPAPANKYAIETLMRRIWGFDGFVTSDCGATNDVYEVFRTGHSWKPAELGGVQVTGPQGAAWSLKAGTDVDCWASAYRNELPTALGEGWATEQDWDVALTRAFTIRMQLGEFDDAAKVPWANTSYLPTDPEHGITSASHWATAHQMSLEAPVLLKNDTVSGTPALPLTDTTGNTVVLGYYATHAIHGGYSPGATANTISAAQGIEKIVGNGNGDYTDDPNLYVNDNAIHNMVGAKPASGNLVLLNGTSQVSTVSFWDFFDETGWTKEPGFFGSAFTATQSLSGGFKVPVTIPATGVDQLRLPLTGSDTLAQDTASSPTPCGGSGQAPCNTIANFRVKLNGQERVYPLQYSSQVGAGSQITTSYLPLVFPLSDFGSPTGNQTVEFTFEISGATSAGLNLTECATPGCTAADANTDEYKIRNAANVVVYVGTRESDSDEERDREFMSLPRYQADLAAKAAEWNPRSVVWIQAVSQVDVTPFKDVAPAIIETTYNGEFQGHAVGEILFNRAVDVDANPSTPAVQANPSGHLSYTYYSDVDNQLTKSTDYSLSKADGAKCGRTYWYYQSGTTGCDAPYYPFGHGLSYTTFTYTDLALSSTAATPNDTVNVSVKVTNSGALAGRAVAQLYASSPLADGNARPYKQLKGFAKTALLAPGASETVTIPLKATELWFWDTASQKQVFDQGNWTVQVGPSSAATGAQTATLALSGARKAGVDVVAAVPDGVQLNVKTPNNAIHANLSATKYDQSFWDLSSAAVKVVYTSGNASVAKVDSTGAVLPVGVGQTLITATVTADGESKSTTFPVVVRTGRPSVGATTAYTAQVAFADRTAELAAAKSGVQLAAGVYPSQDAVYSYQIAPMDLNEAGATVTPAGVFKATKVGTVRVTVVAEVDGALVSRSAHVKVVADVPAPTAPVVSVNVPVAKVGASVTVTPGGVPAGAGVAYQWLRGGVAVPGATKATYVPGAADLGKALAVRVTVTLNGKSTVVTKVVGAIAKGAIKAGAVAVKGTAKVGKKLRAAKSGWTSGVTYSYKWYAGSKAIKKATKATFKVTKAQAGKKIKVKVTAKKAGYANKAKTSKATKKIKK